MSRLALYVLGPPRIERDGVPIKVDTRKAVALLAYVAVTATSHPRASLLNLLWPEYDRTHGGAALRRTLYALQKALAGAWLDVDREAVGLNPSADVWLDVAEFRRHLAACQTHGHPTTRVCAACVAPLSQAVALYRGDFLSGFGLKDSYNFDDWQCLQSEALQREFAAALEGLVQWHSAQREFETALAHARRWLALDSLDERVHCQLMQLYAWSGQRPAALRQYEECAKILEEQLGVSPAEETTQLWHTIKEGHAPPLPSAERVPDVEAALPSFLREEGAVERPVFVAREAELAQLFRFLEAALAGRGRVIFVTGDAGCGKTALIQEFARRAQASHADLVVASGHGNAHTGIGDPYLPFREILALLSGDVDAQWAARAISAEQARRLWHVLPVAVPALVESGRDLIDLFVPGGSLVRRAEAFAQRPVDSAWLVQLKELVARQGDVSTRRNLQQSALFEQYTAVVRAVARRKPLLLALDDLQWADDGSVNLLFHLGRQIEGSAVLIVGAYRSSEVALGRAAPSLLAGAQKVRERHPLEPVVNELKRTFGDIELDLERAAGRQFVDAFLDSEPNQLGEAFRETLCQHTAGYPLFTVELLRGMEERGDLVRDREGRWIEGPALDWEMLPARVEAVIAERIGRLPEGLRDVLATASVEGETFTAEVIARVQGSNAAETVHRLSDWLDRKHRLVSAQGVLRLDGQRLSRYRFRHILFQKHVYNSLDPVQRVHLHEAVGAALEALYGEGAQEAEAVVPQLARHFQEAGSSEKAVEYLHQAGERAQRLYANAQAVEYFRQALAWLDKDTWPPSRLAWRHEMAAHIQQSLGDVLEWTGQHHEARAAYEAALAHVPPGDPVPQAQLHREIGNVWRVQRRYEKALEAYDLAQAVLGPASGQSTADWWQEWVQIQLERVWMHYWLGEWRERSELAQVREGIEQRGTPAQRVNFLLAVASMNSRRDRYVISEETLDLCQRALAISQEAKNVGDMAWARFVLGFSQVWHGDLDEAEEQMQAALAQAEQSGDVVHQSRCLTYLTILYRKRGETGKVKEYASRSLTAATAAEMAEYTGMARANLAWVAWREGDRSRTGAEGRAALRSWQQLPVGHASCAFQWTALWPLIAASATGERMREAVEWLRALLEPTQQRLPKALAAEVEEAITACDGEAAPAARTHLDHALQLAQELGYL